MQRLDKVAAVVLFVAFLIVFAFIVTGHTGPG